jgi:integrase
VATFVEHVFLPEQVTTKKRSGRIHYQAILKHVLTPEEVDRMFHPGSESRRRLKARPEWPYLSRLRLDEVRPEDIQRLLEAALAQGYSHQTVKHIRSVISTVFTYAWKKRLFWGDNPATLVPLPPISRGEAQVLTLIQTRQVLGAMRYPAKEMAMVAMLTGMNIAEVCGLQWKFVNLTTAWSDGDADPIPPRSIAVRRQWYLGELGTVNRKSQNRIVPISDSLLPILRLIRTRVDFTGPDDFVLVSKRGRPINERHIAVSHLKPIGNGLQVTLSWQVLRRTRAMLQNEFGMLFHDLIAPQSGPDSERRVNASFYQRLAGSPS